MDRRISRRAFLIATGVVGAGGGTTLLSCARSSSSGLTAVSPGSGLVASFERRRRGRGAQVRDVTLTAKRTSFDLGGRTVSTWAYGDTIPGPEVRVRAGDVLRATLRNRLPDETTIHWHGIALRNDMDGVPGLTQPPVAPGGEFVYEFTVPDPGTYFFHPHVGTQLDRGLYAPMIVEDPSDPGDYDREAVVVLDDWIDGVRRSPNEVLDGLLAGTSGSGGMNGMDSGAMGGASPPGSMGAEMGDEASENPSSEGPLGDDTGDVRYPSYLINGRPPTDPMTFRALPGERVRLRIINAGSDTPFRVALGGHRLTVTHTDGFPVRPVTVDSLILGMGERYDAIVTVGASGTFPLVAQAEGKGRMGALAVLRSGSGETPMADVRPAELTGRLLAPADLRPEPDVTFPETKPDRTYDALLTGDMATYRWGMRPDRQGGVTLPVRVGERVRLTLENRTVMWHPLHLHGHTFQVRGTSGPGPRKDTVIVPAMERVQLDIVADNPGQWALHCHNIYHAEVGMQTVLSYVT